MNDNITRFTYLNGGPWAAHCRDAEAQGFVIEEMGITLNETHDGTIFFVDVDDKPAKSRGIVRKVGVGETGEFEITPFVKCPVCDARLGEYWENLADNKRIDCEECGAVMDIEIEHKWYYRVKTFKELD